MKRLGLGAAVFSGVGRPPYDNSHYKNTNLRFNRIFGG